MKNLTQERLNEKRTTLEMKWEELTALIENEVREYLAVRSTVGLSITIRTKQREEGSPAYKTDKYDFFIDVVEKVHD